MSVSVARPPTLVVHSPSDFCAGVVDAITFRAKQLKSNVTSISFKSCKKSHLVSNGLIVIVFDQDFQESGVKQFIDLLGKLDKNLLQKAEFTQAVFGAVQDISMSAHIRMKLRELGAKELFNRPVRMLPKDQSIVKSIAEDLWKEEDNQTEQSKKEKPQWVDKELLGAVFRENVPIHQQLMVKDRLCDCFLGNEAVDWLCENGVEGKKVTRPQAVGIGQMLLQAGLFSHITGEFSFKDRPILYRFTSTDERRRKWCAPPEWMS